jgi:hypothetical protein
MFDLPQRGIELLRAIHLGLRDQAAPIAASDMQFTGGNSLADVCATVRMYGGKAVIEVTTEKFSVRFSEMQNYQHVDLCKRCVRSAWSAFDSVFPDTQLGHASVRSSLQLELADQSDAKEFLRQLMPNDSQLAWKDLGDVVEHPGVSLELENAGESWNGFLNMYHDHTASSSLIVSYTAMYGSESTIRALADQFDHSERLLAAFLKRCGLAASESSVRED